VGACSCLECRACPRLAAYLDEVRASFPEYHARPVPPFGPEDIDLLIVGLAPGMHGANATGRPFTGDHAGVILYETMYRFGFSSGPVSSAADDDLTLHRCRITNAVKCLPPGNKPTGSEIATCNRFLAEELAQTREGVTILALGRIAHQAILKALGLKYAAFPFAHAAEHDLAGRRTLIDSYHCSRYNTQTRRLTPTMFDGVFARLCQRIEASGDG